MNKQFEFLSIIVLLVFGLLVISSCDSEDVTGGIGGEEIIEIPQGPSLMFKDSVSILAGPSGQVRPDSTFKVIIEAERGDSLLASLEVFINGQPLPISDFTVNGEMQQSNFFDLMGEDQNDFVWEFEIRALDTFTRVIYEFRLTAEDNRTDGVAITINTTLSESSPPNIELINSEQDTVLIGEFASFLVRVDALGSAIDNISVFRGANLVEISELMFDGLPFDSNPLPLVGDDRRFFEKEVMIKSDNPAGQVQNTLILIDSLGAEFNIELNFVNQ